MVLGDEVADDHVPAQIRRRRGQAEMIVHDDAGQAIADQLVANDDVRVHGIARTRGEEPYSAPAGSGKSILFGVVASDRVLIDAERGRLAVERRMRGKRDAAIQRIFADYVAADEVLERRAFVVGNENAPRVALDNFPVDEE